MKNTVTLIHSKDNLLEFDASIHGVEDADAVVRFVIKTKDVELMFQAVRKDGTDDTWLVKIPRSAKLEKKSYDCYIMVVVDGYYFEPLTGKVQVIELEEPKVTVPKNGEAEKADAAAKAEKAAEAEKAAKAEKTARAVEAAVAASKAASKEKPAVKESIPAPTSDPVPASTQPMTSRVVNTPGNDLADSIERIAHDLMQQQKYTPSQINEKVQQVRDKAAQVGPGNKDEKVLAILEEVGLKRKTPTQH